MASYNGLEPAGRQPRQISHAGHKGRSKVLLWPTLEQSTLDFNAVIANEFWSQQTLRSSSMNPGGF
jgi:hypothetical protein